MPKKRIFLLLLTTGILLFQIFTSASAEPSPTLIIVRHDTKQCAHITGGDECTNCNPPEGWEILGYSYQVNCPVDYQVVQLDPICVPIKNQFCCTQGHSGLPGECDDLVINRFTKNCALVENIETCDLPPGWLSKPPDDPELDWLCPYAEDRWIDTLNCQGGEPITEDEDSNISARIVSSLIAIGLSVICFTASAVGVLFWVIRKKALSENQFNQEK